MRKSELRQKIQELNDNLHVNCCANEITVVAQRSKSNILPQVKLYKDKIDAFNESNNFEWHLLDEILDLNNSGSRNTKIDCHSEEQVCIISLIIRKYENSTTTMFTKINKLEIIYI